MDKTRETATKPEDDTASAEYLSAVTLDENSLRPVSRDIMHERRVAIYDLLEENSFHVLSANSGPYSLHLSARDNRLIFEISDKSGDFNHMIALSMSSFRRIIKDYFAMLEVYYEAICTAPPSRIEAIDMGRRGVHDEGSEILVKRLEGKVEVDKPTARRLFTLICALHWKP